MLVIINGSIALKETTTGDRHFSFNSAALSDAALFLVSPWCLQPGVAEKWMGNVGKLAISNRTNNSSDFIHWVVNFAHGFAPKYTHPIGTGRYKQLPMAEPAGFIKGAQSLSLHNPVSNSLDLSLSGI